MNYIYSTMGMMYLIGRWKRCNEYVSCFCNEMLFYRSFEM